MLAVFPMILVAKYADYEHNSVCKHSLSLFSILTD